MIWRNRMSQRNRRSFLKKAGAGAAAAVMGGAASVQAAPVQKINRLTLGMASYTFRKFDLAKTIEMTTRLGLEKIAFKSYHLAMDSTEAQIKAVAKQTRDAGLDLYGCGVCYMKNEDEVKQTFDYAKAAGMRIIIGVPEHNLLDMVNQKVQEYDIKLAIHNHGPGDERYPSPQSAYEKVSGMDPRMGLCIDIGHTQRIGIDPSVPVEKFFKRVHDIHVKDVTASQPEGSTTEIGRGVIDIPKFLKTLLRLDYKGYASLEYEKNGEDPLPGAAESIGHLRGVLSVI